MQSILFPAPATTQDAAKALKVLKPYMSHGQWLTVQKLCRTSTEEHEYFWAKVKEYATRIEEMPKTYGQDGLGEGACVYLHYFIGSGDWHITEKDSDPDGEGQIQAFGLANLGYGAELGYINIVELVKAGAELDLYWNPRTLAEIKQ